MLTKWSKQAYLKKKIKEKHEKENRPENCENLINTTVNPEIWSKVRSNTRSRDLKMQKLETSLLKSMISIVKMSDKLLEFKFNPKSASESDVSEFVQLSLDSLAFIGHSINEVNIKRRELIKPDLNVQFKQLCGSIPYSQLLRLRRVCSEDSDFSLRSEETCHFFDKRGYPASVVQAGHHRAQQIDCQSALQTSQKENNNRIPFTLTFHPHNHAVKSIILKNLITSK